MGGSGGGGSRRRRVAARIVLAAVALLVAATVLLPLVWPVPPLAGTVPARDLADADSRFVAVDGLDVHYREAGSAGADCVVILLHGFGASTFSWRAALPALARDCRVIAFDRPAFGLTDRPLPGEWSGVNPYSLEASAVQTVGLMDALGIEKAVLVGHSAGAAVAVLVAARYPERVTGLVLEAPAIFSSGGAPSWLLPLLRTPQARRLGPLFVRRLAGRQSDDVVRRAFADPSDVTQAVLDGYRLPLRAENWDRALWEYAAAPRRPDVTGLLRRVQLPMLVVWGEKDRFVSPAASRRTAEASAGPTRTLALPDVGHIPHEESPRVFIEAVRAFMRDVAAGAPASGEVRKGRAGTRLISCVVAGLPAPAVGHTKLWTPTRDPGSDVPCRRHCRCGSG